MSRGVGFGGSSAGRRGGKAGRTLAIDVVCEAESAQSWGSSGSDGVGVASVDWFFDIVSARLSMQPLGTGVETVGFSIVWDVLDGLLVDALLESVGGFPVDLFVVLLLTAFSSSSDEISTTTRADITGCWPLVELAILNL